MKIVRRALVPLLSIVILAMLFFYFHTTNKYQLDRYSHLMYSKMLYQNYERSIMLYADSIVYQLDQMLESQTIQGRDIDTLIEQYGILDLKQNEYSMFISDYSNTGKHLVESLVDREDVFYLDYKYGFENILNVTKFFQQLRWNHDNDIPTDQETVDKLRLVRELTQDMLSIYNKHLGEDFDYSKLEEVVVKRMALQKEIVDHLPDSVEKSRMLFPLNTPSSG